MIAKKLAKIKQYEKALIIVNSISIEEDFYGLEYYYKTDALCYIAKKLINGKHYDQALFIATHSIIISIKEPYEKIEGLCFIADQLIQSKQYNKAQIIANLLGEYIAIANDMEEQYARDRLLIAIAKILAKVKHYNQALAVVEKIRDQNEKIEIIILIFLTASNIGTNFSHLNDEY